MFPRVLAQRDDAVRLADARHALRELPFLIARTMFRHRHHVRDQVVLLLLRHRTGIRRHGNAVHAGFERSEDFLLGPAGAERSGLREVARVDVTILGVSHRRRRRPNAATVVAVAFRALHLRVHIFAAARAP